MLQTAIETEVEEFVTLHRDRRDASRQRQVVRNGYQQARDLLTGAGRLEVQQPRVRDNSSEKEQRISFSSSILPPYLRRSKAR
jgi:transposase-like protein